MNRRGDGTARQYQHRRSISIGSGIHTVTLRFVDQAAEIGRIIAGKHIEIRRLMGIPGVGPLLASALVATIPDPHAFRSGRNLAAWIGLVPKQNSRVLPPNYTRSPVLESLSRCYVGRARENGPAMRRTKEASAIAPGFSFVYAPPMDKPPTKPLEKSGEKLAESAVELARSSERMEDTADRRTELAAIRTVFAAERTYAAWVRTGLFALASGVGARELLKDFMPAGFIAATAAGLLLFSAFCLVAGVWRHLNPGASPPRPNVRQISPFLLIGVNGFLLLVVAAALIGVTFFGTNP